MSIAEVGAKLQAFQGRHVVAVRLPANTLLLYVQPASLENEEATLWLDPPWRHEHGGSVLAGSGDVSDVSRERIIGILRRFEGTPIQGFTIEPVSHDLVLELGDGHLVRTFNDSPSESEWPGWSLRDPREQLRYCVFPGRVQVEESAAE